MFKKDKFSWKIMRLYKYLKLLLGIPLLWISRVINYPLIKPLSIALYTTYDCNSKCLTCNIWKHEKNIDTSIKELKTLFKSVGNSPVWFTLTGGETFLRPDLNRVVKLICKYNKPLYINIATNGLATSVISKRVKSICEICYEYGVQLTINFSLDGIGSKYDKIRGVKNGFNSVMNSISEIKKIQSDYPNTLNIGINVTVSKYNVDDFYEIYDFIHENLMPVSLIIEIATSRKAFFLEGTKQLLPDIQKFIKVLDFMIERELPSLNKTGNLIGLFRRKYYSYVKNVLLTGKGLPCYAGLASMEILPDARVISCCMNSYNLGNLKKSGFRLTNILKSKLAKQSRKTINETNCTCTLSNPYYTNSILNLKL